MSISISDTSLKAVRDRTSLFKFLKGELGWQVDHEDPFTYNVALEGHIATRAEVSQIVPFGANDPYLILLVEFETQFRRGDLRQILREILAKIRREGRFGGKKMERIVFVCATERYSGIRFVRFEEREERTPKMSVFGWEAGSSDGTRTLRGSNLPDLKMPPPDIYGDHDWTKAKWEQAWNVEKVTDEFYKRYQSVFESMVAQVSQGGVTGDARLFTLRLCNRLMFLQFLAKKGWLNQDRTYLKTLWEVAREYAKKPGVSHAKHSNYYADYLWTLFFKALNTPTDERLSDVETSAQSASLGDVPFLNGGLFAPQDSDDERYAVNLANDAFTPLLELFDDFNFTLTESTPDDVEVAVDPEMLGKAFERLVTEPKDPKTTGTEPKDTKRHDIGAYYTPRGIVSFMCREALKGYLGGGEAIAKFVDSGDASDLPDPEGVLQQLKQVTVCDPACGSGAYLLGMMQELLHLRESLFTAKARDFRLIYDRKLEIIQRNLYGVDKEAFAVNIAMLRLWLSLVVDMEADAGEVVTGAVDVSLPNLKFKIQEGDSLTAPLVDFSLQIYEYVKDANELRDFEKEYFAPPSHNKAKRPKAEIEGDIDKTQKKIVTLLGTQAPETAIDWSVQFAEVFANRGFDIVLANPPYVRQELIKELKPTLKTVYPQVYTGTADLYCFFYARAIQILKPGGMLAFISPNKWFRAGYGANLRKHIAETCRVESITDFGELPVFEAAATFPMVFIAQKGRENTSALFTQVKSLEAPYPDVLELVQAQGQRLPKEAINGADWTLTDSVSADRLRKMEKAGVPLGEYVKGQIFRGVLTGFNKAFVIDGAKRAELISKDPNSAEIIKTLAVGDDVRRWRIEHKDRWLIVTKIGVEIERYPAIFAHLQQWQSELEKRYDKGEHWWELRACAYYEAFDKPKIVYPEIAMSSRFAYDTQNTYPLKTAFSIPTSDLYLLGVLNSALAWEYLKQVCSVLGDENERGRLTLQSIFVSKLPIPTASDAEKSAISALVQKCLDAKGAGCEAWEAEIDARVAALYGL